MLLTAPSIEEDEEYLEEVESSGSRDLAEDHLASLTATTDEGNYSECGDNTSSEDKSSNGSNRWAQLTLRGPKIKRIKIKNKKKRHKRGFCHLRGSATQNLLIFQLCFTMLKMKLYVCKNFCENFRQIGQKMKKL